MLYLWLVIFSIILIFHQLYSSFPNVLCCCWLSKIYIKNSNVCLISIISLAMVRICVRLNYFSFSSSIRWIIGSLNIFHLTKNILKWKPRKVKSVLGFHPQNPDKEQIIRELLLQPAFSFIKFLWVSPDVVWWCFDVIIDFLDWFLPMNRREFWIQGTKWTVV